MRLPREDSPPSSTTVKNTNSSLAPLHRRVTHTAHICVSHLERRLLIEPLLERELHELRSGVRSFSAIAARVAASTSSVVVGGTRAAGAGSFADGAAGADTDATSAPKPPAVAGAGGAAGGGC